MTTSYGRKASDIASAGGTNYSAVQYSYDALSRLDCSTVRMNPAIYGSLPSSACTLGTAGSYGNDRVTRQSYDQVGNVTQVITAYGTSDQANQMVATYSNNDHQLTFTDGMSNKTSYTYDGFDRLSQTLFPSPTQSAGSSDATNYEQLTYDAASNVTVARKRNGSTISYTYDNLNRLTGETLPTGNSNLNPSFTYDLLGRITLASNTNSVYSTSVSLTYDALGRKTSESSTINGAYAATKTSQYDLAGNRTRLTWGDGFYVTYAYDVANEMTSINENGSSQLAFFAYDDLGRRTQMVRGDGTFTNYGYDGCRG